MVWADGRRQQEDEMVDVTKLNVGDRLFVSTGDDRGVCSVVSLHRSGGAIVGIRLRNEINPDVCCDISAGAFCGPRETFILLDPEPAPASMSAEAAEKVAS